MDRRFREAGINPDTVSVLKRLALVGEGGFGALTYHPADSDEGYEFRSLEEAVLFSREVLELNSEALPGSVVLQQAGSNPGGRYPKLCVGWHPESGDLVVGTQNYPEGFQPCLLKLDLDIERSTAERGICRREFTMIESAKRCGIRVPEHRLLCSNEPDGSRREHLLVGRFDRRDGRKIHLHSFSGVAHKLPIRYGNSYEELMRTVYALTRDQREVEEMYRRTVFNVLCGNRDDHVRNHAFLMHEPDVWQLSPAYDLTPTPQIEEHCLSVNGKWANIGVDDLVALGEAFSVRQIPRLLGQIQCEAERLGNGTR
jgi:serine/threonine-protein kinase HipA